MAGFIQSDLGGGNNMTIKEIYDFIHERLYGGRCATTMHKLSEEEFDFYKSVNELLQPKTAMKIHEKLRVNYITKCSNCGHTLGHGSDNYCGNCGAKFTEND